MASSDIAVVVADILSKRVQHGILPLRDPKLVELSEHMIGDPKVVNATAIYQGIKEGGKDVIHLYDDYPSVAPPWEEFIITYENVHGNVIVMHANAFDRYTLGVNATDIPWRSLAEDHEIDWPRVRWEINTFVYAGGQSGRGHMPTAGPLMMWRYAVYEDGKAADLYWINLWDEVDEDNLTKKGLDFANFVMMGSLNFLNCRNVQIVEEQHERAERKRIQKTGVTMNEINIYPMGKRSTYAKPGEPGAGVPLSSVRGYFATYTEERPLFGKYPGRFWVPQHARGKRELGERNNSYRLRNNQARRTPHAGVPNTQQNNAG